MIIYTYVYVWIIAYGYMYSYIYIYYIISGLYLWWVLFIADVLWYGFTIWDLCVLCLFFSPLANWKIQEWNHRGTHHLDDTKWWYMSCRLKICFCGIVDWPTKLYWFFWISLVYKWIISQHEWTYSLIIAWKFHPIIYSMEN